MKIIAILILLTIIAGLCISIFAGSRYKAENPETFDPEKDILCGIHTQEGVEYSILGEISIKKDGTHYWFYPNGDIFTVEVIIPKGVEFGQNSWFDFGADGMGVDKAD